MSDVVDDAEAAQGGSAGDSSSPDEKAGLIAALQAERGKRHTLERQMSELKGTVDTLKQAQEQPKEISREDLQTRVDSGRMSQVDADRILEDQQARRLESKVSTNIETRLQDQQRAQRIQSEIDRYKDVKPEIMDEGSEARRLVAEAYSYHVNDLGKPENLQTELDALITVYGPAAKLQTGQQQQAQTHQETGSDGGESAQVEGKPPKGLSKDMKDFYGRKIEQGFYKDWKEVEKELAYASPRVKARQGIA